MKQLYLCKYGSLKNAIEIETISPTFKDQLCCAKVGFFAAFL